MKIFKKRNTSVPGDVCPICGRNTPGETVLVSIVGTQDGNLCEAKQFHFDCMDLTWDKKNKLLFQRTKA